LKSNDKVKILEAYFISQGLIAVFFYTYNSTILIDKTCKLLDIKISEYRLFSLLNSGLVNSFSGTVDMNNMREFYGEVYLTNDIFTNFLVKEVNMMDVLNDDKIDTELSLDDFSNDIYNSLNEMSKTIVEQRGIPTSTPPTSTPPTSTPSSVSTVVKEQVKDDKKPEVKLELQKLQKILQDIKLSRKPDSAPGRLQQQPRSQGGSRKTKKNKKITKRKRNTRRRNNKKRNNKTKRKNRKNRKLKKKRKTRKNRK